MAPGPRLGSVSSELCEPPPVTCPQVCVAFNREAPVSPLQEEGGSLEPWGDLLGLMRTCAACLGTLPLGVSPRLTETRLAPSAGEGEPGDWPPGGEAVAGIQAGPLCSLGQDSSPP